MWNYLDSRAMMSSSVLYCVSYVEQLFLHHQGNTTNLYNHLKFNHRVQYEECLSVKKKAPSDARTATQTPITTSLFSASPYPAGSRRQIEITEAITHFIAKDMAPINTVCSAGFKKLINTLDKRYHPLPQLFFSSCATFTLCKMPGKYWIRSAENRVLFHHDWFMVE